MNVGLEVLSGNVDAITKKEFIQMEQKNLDRIEWLVTSLLKMSRLDSGSETLKIKETDRLVALKNELEKLGAIIRITDDSLAIEGYQDFSETPTFETYNDHRMAMCMAPLAQKYAIRINNEMVVEKSYPTFWEDWKQLGFEIKSI